MQHPMPNWNRTMRQNVVATGPIDLWLIPCIRSDWWVDCPDTAETDHQCRRQLFDVADCTFRQCWRNVRHCCTQWIRFECERRRAAHPIAGWASHTQLPSNRIVELFAIRPVGKDRWPVAEDEAESGLLCLCLIVMFNFILFLNHHVLRRSNEFNGASFYFWTPCYVTIRFSDRIILKFIGNCKKNILPK